MLKLIRKRFILLSAICALLAFVVLATKTFAPNYRIVAFIFFGLSCASLIASIQRKKILYRKNRTNIKGVFKGYGLQISVAFSLIIFVYCAQVLMPFSHSPLTGLSNVELSKELAADTGTSLFIQEKLEEQRIQLVSEIGKVKDNEVLMEKHRKKLLDLWFQWLSSLIETDILKKKYAGFYQIDYLSQPKNHAQAFWVSYGNLCHQYINVYQVQNACMGKSQIQILLNEPIPHLGNKSDILYYLKQQLTNNKNLLRLSAGRAYSKLVDKELQDLPFLHEQVDKALQSIDAGLLQASSLVVRNPLAKLEKIASERFFPIQKQVALNMSFIRVSNKPYGIQSEDIQPHIPTLQPGDILLERRNWHITNAGIPGFWPHTALYSGSIDELNEFFNGLPALGAKTFSEMLKANYPNIYLGLQDLDKNKNKMRVLEAKRPGVVFLSLEDSANCDYFAALRTQCDKGEIYQALLNSFIHYKKPYDFNFDFATDEAMVCSELVYKAYQPTGKLPIPLEQVSGRALIPPNSFVKYYGGNPDVLSPILFLESSENGVEKADLSELKDSWKRPKWSFMQN